MDALAGEIGARHQAIEPFARSLRLFWILVELRGSVPILTTHHVPLRDAWNHLRGAPARRLRMCDLLVLEVDVDGIVPGWGIERRVHIVVEREPAGAVEDHVPPGRAVGAIAEVARAIEILRGIHQGLLYPEVVLPGGRKLERLAVLVGKPLLVGV